LYITVIEMQFSKHLNLNEKRVPVMLNINGVILELFLVVARAYKCQRSLKVLKVQGTGNFC